MLLGLESISVAEVEAASAEGYFELSEHDLDQDASVLVGISNAVAFTPICDGNGEVPFATICADNESFFFERR